MTRVAGVEMLGGAETPSLSVPKRALGSIKGLRYFVRNWGSVGALGALGDVGHWGLLHFERDS